MSKEIAPIVIDLGRASRKRIRALQEGTGELVDDIAEVLDRVRAELGPEADGKELVPVVVIYKRKKSRKKSESLIDLLLSKSR
jgi:hypothetical protein